MEGITASVSLPRYERTSPIAEMRWDVLFPINLLNPAPSSACLSHTSSAQYSPSHNTEQIAHSLWCVYGKATNAHAHKQTWRAKQIKKSERSEEQTKCLDLIRWSAKKKTTGLTPQGPLQQEPRAQHGEGHEVRHLQQARPEKCAADLHLPEKTAQGVDLDQNARTHTRTHKIYVTNGQQPRQRAAVKTAGCTDLVRNSQNKSNSIARLC